jgi:Tfp pilus assembly protein PilO
MEIATYDDALDKSQELRKIRDQKIAAFNTFTVEDKSRLERILPDNVDNIHLLIDINNIAARHGLSLKDVALGTPSDAATVRSAAAVGASGDAIGSVPLGFTLSASYDDFLAFLQDLEHSLRVVDVEKISFSEDDTKNVNDYTLSIRTYWLH